jgi:NAD-dependent aldehyde dehydrogenases
LNRAGTGERDPLSNVTLIDRTAKLFIGGKQVRPDSGYSLPVHAPDGTLVGEVGEGNRKDIRNAVEAARAAQKWSQASTHNRAQVLFYLAENLAVRADEFARQLVIRNGATEAAAHAEVEAAVHASLHLRGVGRQVRRRRAYAAAARRRAGNARAARRDRHCLP